MAIIGIVGDYFYCFHMGGKKKKISKIEHLVHVILTLGTNGVWLLIYLPRLFLGWKKSREVVSNHGSPTSNSKVETYFKRKFASLEDAEADEWNEFSDPFTFQIVGESHYRDNLLATIEAQGAHKLGEIYIEAVLQREPQNKFDEYAVCVIIEGKKVGHIPKEYSFEVSEFLNDRNCVAIKVNAVIGWNTNSPNPPIGVRLDFNF